MHETNVKLLLLIFWKKVITIFPKEIEIVHCKYISFLIQLLKIMANIYI